MTVVGVMKQHFTWRPSAKAARSLLFGDKGSRLEISISVNESTCEGAG